MSAHCIDVLYHSCLYPAPAPAHSVGSARSGSPSTVKYVTRDANGRETTHQIVGVRQRAQ